MKGLTFQCRSPRTHGQCTRTLGTKHSKNSNLQVCLSKFVALSRNFCGFCFPPLPDLMPAADAAAAAARSGARCSASSSYPHNPTKPHTFLTAHMMNYIVYNIAHQNLGWFFLTTFDAFDLHALAAPPSAHDGPSSCLREEQTCVLF